MPKPWNHDLKMPGLLDEPATGMPKPMGDKVTPGHSTSVHGSLASLASSSSLVAGASCAEVINPPNAPIFEHRPSDHWLAVDQTQNVLNSKQLAELELIAAKASDPSLREFFPLLADAYRRLHGLGRHAAVAEEIPQPEAAPTE